jgi:hypothetical protein
VSCVVCFRSYVYLHTHIYLTTHLYISYYWLTTHVDHTYQVDHTCWPHLPSWPHMLTTLTKLTTLALTTLTKYLLGENHTYRVVLAWFFIHWHLWSFILSCLALISSLILVVRCSYVIHILTSYIAIDWYAICPLSIISCRDRSDDHTCKMCFTIDHTCRVPCSLDILGMVRS